MARIRQYRYFSCDFETTVYKGQKSTEVWASACVELYTEDVKILGSIEETFSYFRSLKSNIVAYYHNLKFDGSFWLDFLMKKLKLKPASYKKGTGEYDVSWYDIHKMQNNTFRYSISSKGQWYNIIIKIDNYIIELRDSLKLLPFSVKKIGKDFKTKHQKLEMKYEGFRYANCKISEKEKLYISNDVLVIKEALEFMFNQGHNKITIGSCCLSEYKSIIGKEAYKSLFPQLYDEKIDNTIYSSKTIGDYIRKSYKGGWCYLVKGKEGKVYKKGLTADVNSLYPSMMSSESGNRYPVGLPTFWKGNFIPEEAEKEDKYYFIRIKTRFYLKKDKLPFIQIKGSLLYKGTEALETSDVKCKKTGEYSAYYTGLDGTIKDTRVELTLTQTDYKLFREHYDVLEFEILDGCYFNTAVGLFDEYIEKYKKQKLESTGALKQLAKLFLNNLYGKFASSTDSSFKYAYIKDDNTIGFVEVEENEKEAGYIAIGSAITSYARNFTIRSAQANYHGKDKPGFIYADTDSIHCDLSPSEVVGIKIHDKNFCCWKLESLWDTAIFTRQKTYIEHVTHEDLQEIEKPYYNIKCAGMPDRCKDLFEMSMRGYYPSEKEIKEKDYNEEHLQFLKEKRNITDFKIGLKIPGKLMPKRIPGGILLVETTYEMR